jgi:acyl dehydratase
MTPQKVDYANLTPGYEFAPASFTLDGERVRAYLKAVQDSTGIYETDNTVPPMAIGALAMTAMAEGLLLPPGAIHVSQELKFMETVRQGETLTSYARVSRKVERGKFRMLAISINVLNQKKTPVLTGETSFILPLT